MSCEEGDTCMPGHFAVATFLHGGGFCSGKRGNVDIDTRAVSSSSYGRVYIYACMCIDFCPFELNGIN
jgi:hypothetical protein